MASAHSPALPRRVALLNLGPESRVTLHRLALRDEDDQCIVGRIATGQFVALPEMGKKVIHLLQQGSTLGQAQARLKEDVGAEVDLEAFVSTLGDLGFVRAVDDQPVLATPPAKPSLPWLRPHHVRWLFSTPPRVLYAGLLLSALFTVITNPSLIPRYQDFLWSTVTSITIAVNTGMGLIRLALHEIAHLVAARSLGVPARIRLGTRLQHLVAQTDVSSLWAVARRLRYRVYLAGMIFDLGTISLCILVLGYVPLPALAQGILKGFVLLTFFSIVGQFHFYMRTDVYFVVLDLLKCYNLFHDSISHAKYLFRTAASFVRRSAAASLVDPLQRLSANERQKVRVYAWFVIAGSAFALFLYAVYSIPIMIRLLVTAASAAWQGLQQGEFWHFLDGLVTLLVAGSLQAVFLFKLAENRVPALAKIRARFLGRPAVSPPAEIVAASQELQPPVPVLPSPAAEEEAEAPIPVMVCESCGNLIPTPAESQELIYLAVCPFCLARLSTFELQPIISDPVRGPSPDPRARFRDLMASVDMVPQGIPLPASILDELPQETRALLTPRLGLAPSALPFAVRSGYTDEEQAEETDLEPLSPSARPDAPRRTESAEPAPPRPIQWMLLELDGDAANPAKRLRCPRCNAELPAGLYECACDGVTQPDR